MEISLSEFGSTIAIGMYALIVIDFTIYAFWNFSLFQNYSSSLSKAGSISRLVFYMIMGFSAGMIAENLSNKFSDESEIFLLDQDSYIRSQRIFDTGDGTLTSLGKGLYDAGLLQKYGLMTNEDPSEVVDSLYYDAKNVVFQVGSYFDELSKIQMRIDFSRSFAFISFYLIIVSAVLLIVIGASRLAGFVSRGKIVIFSKMQSVSFGTLFLIVSISLWKLGSLSFSKEEAEFDTRVFGYFRTLNNSKDNQSSKNKIEFPPLSGLVHYKGNTFIAVTDEKDNRAPRVFVLEVDSINKQRLYPLKINWGEQLAKDRPTDIESVCFVDETIWLLESSGFPDERSDIWRANGRLVPLSIAAYKIPFISQVDFAFQAKNPIEMVEVNNLEGLECWKENDKLYFLTAERGDNNVPSMLTKYRYDGEGILSEEQKYPVPKNQVLETRSEYGSVRWVSGLGLGSNSSRQTETAGENSRKVWAVGAIDTNDSSSMSGVLYELGSLNSQNLQLLEKSDSCILFPEDKVEGISITGNPGEFLVVVDNEDYGRVILRRRCE